MTTDGRQDVGADAAAVENARSAEAVPQLSHDVIAKQCNALADRFEALANPARVDAPVSADALLEAVSLLRGYSQVALIQGLPCRKGCEAVEAANVTLSTENAQLRQALRVIRKGLTEDADGTFWPARRWLDTRKVFNDDVSGHRVLELVAKHVLHGDTEICVCCVDDSLVQEWVSKARDVAKAKGWKVGSGTEPQQRSER